MMLDWLDWLGNCGNWWELQSAAHWLVSYGTWGSGGHTVISLLLGVALLCLAPSFPDAHPLFGLGQLSGQAESPGQGLAAPPPVQLRRRRRPSGRLAGVAGHVRGAWRDGARAAHRRCRHRAPHQGAGCRRLQGSAATPSLFVSSNKSLDVARNSACVPHSVPAVLQAPGTRPLLSFLHKCGILARGCLLTIGPESTREARLHLPPVSTAHDQPV